MQSMRSLTQVAANPSIEGTSTSGLRPLAAAPCEIRSIVITDSGPIVITDSEMIVITDSGGIVISRHAHFDRFAVVG